LFEGAVLEEVGGEECEVGFGVGEVEEKLGFGGVADCGVDVVALREEFLDEVTGNEAICACDAVWTLVRHCI